MTQSFDEPKRVRSSHSAKASKAVSSEPRRERRRAPRWKAHVPVFVYGHDAGQAPFHEDAYSTVVSEHGALLNMTTAVRMGDKLLLTNEVTQDQQECRVTSVGQREGPSIQVAIEFAVPSSQFWRLTAPPRHAESVLSVEQHRRAR